MLGLEPGHFGLIVLAAVTVSILLLWRVVHSPLGLTIRQQLRVTRRARFARHRPRALCPLRDRSAARRSSCNRGG